MPSWLRTVALVGMLSCGLLACAQERCAAANSYFPSSEFRDLEKYNADEPAAWSKYLSLFKEPVLFRDNSSVFVVRLTVAPAFSAGMIIRISEGRNGLIVGVSKDLPRGGSGPTSDSFPVNAGDLALVKRALATEDFWNLGNHQSVVTTDGMQLLLEVRQGKKYHVVYTNGPVDNPLFRIARTLLDIAHQHFPGENQPSPK